MNLSIKYKKSTIVSSFVIIAALSGCATTAPEPAAPPAVKPIVVAPPPPVAAPAPVAPAPTPIVVVPKTDPTPPVASNDGPGEKDLADGMALYDSGDYRGAQRKLLAAQNAASETSMTKQTSMKMLAFTYCLTNQRAPCRQQFNNLLKLNPKFELTKSEAGHPLWGPVFVQAKKDQLAVKK
jgi:hypothetical protein